MCSADNAVVNATVTAFVFVVVPAGAGTGAYAAVLVVVAHSCAAVKQLDRTESLWRLGVRV